MKHQHKELPSRADTRTLSSWLTMLMASVLLAACGGGAGTSASQLPGSAATCDPNDPGTFDECGTVMVALTDADGDFLNYTVDVLSLKLETANGRVVETLPRQTRINFSDYVDLTELVTVATIPPGTYTSGTISLDYSDAELFVEAGGNAKAAVVTNVSGETLDKTSLRIELSNRDRLIVSKGRPAYLQLDFDLGASHTVDITATPAVAVSEQFIVAEVAPVEEKDLRVRGPLVDVSVDEMSYAVAIRPFHDRDGDFGHVTVKITDDTEFEVDQSLYSGIDGLHALRDAGSGTPTVATGSVNIAQREFTATAVFAGTSVPGIGRDAVIGNVIKRDGEFLTIRGATVVPSDRRMHFHDDVVVQIGPETRVFKDGDRASDLSIRDISIGQRVTIRGSQPTSTNDSLAPLILFDATQGSVRMHLTRLSGVVKTIVPGETDITVHSIDRRRVALFDFTGTGQSSAQDADPENYTIATGALTLADFAAGHPIVARGFPTAFGWAPPDFTGRTIIDYTDVRSSLGVGWGVAGTTQPFSSVSSDSLILNNRNPDIDERHYIKQGPVLVDLTALDSDTTIVPRASDRLAFYIRLNDSVRMYSDFGEFTDELGMSLADGNVARSFHARGSYDGSGNLFTAYKIGVYLLQP